jgi:hypothetical protein
VSIKNSMARLMQMKHPCRKNWIKDKMPKWGRGIEMPRIPARLEIKKSQRWR